MDYTLIEVAHASITVILCCFASLRTRYICYLYIRSLRAASELRVLQLVPNIVACSATTHEI